MNEADQYAKRTLKCRYCLRYADDIFVLCHNKRDAARVLRDLSAFLRGALHLTPNPVKSFIAPACTGYTALGYRVYPTHILLSSQNKRRVKRRIRTGQMTRQSFQSWMTYASEANCHSFVNSLHGALP